MGDPIRHDRSRTEVVVPPIRHGRGRGRGVLRMVPPVVAGVLAGVAVAFLLAYGIAALIGQLPVWMRP